MSEMVKNEKPSGWESLVSGLRRPSILMPALAVVTVILYSGTLLFQFVWDDETQIVDNPIVRSLGNLHRVFTSDLWYHTGSFQVYYRPLFIVWSILNYAVFGLHPWGWHLGAVLLHVAAVVAVFLLVRKLGLEYWTAALAAFIFALHPIHIECVAWISAASDSMVTAFTALAFIAFLNTREPEARHVAEWRVASLVLFACALLTKEIVLGFSLLIGLYELLYPRNERLSLGQKVRAAILIALPYAVLTAGYLLFRTLTLARLAGNSDPAHTLKDVFLALPYVLTFYLRQLILPTGLTGLYYTPYATAESTRYLFPAVLVLGCLAGVIFFWSRKKADPLVLFAGSWMLICLAPALYLRSFADGDFVRDRYIYLGSVGFAILVAKLIRLLPSIGPWNVQTTQMAGLVTLCSAYLVMSLMQQVYWNSDLLIYARAYQLYPQNPVAAVALAREYSHMGAYDRAIPIVEEVQRTSPQYVYGAYALAYVYIGAGRKEQGRAALLHAQNVMPQYMNGETGAASVAAMWGQLGDYERAGQLCSQVLTRDPDLYSALYNCGVIQIMAGHYEAAEPLLRRAVKAAPELAAPRHFLGRALFLDGKYAEGQQYLSQAVQMDPAVYDNHYWLGRSFEQSGNPSAAKEEYRRALQLNEDSAEAKLHLAALDK